VPMVQTTYARERRAAPLPDNRTAWYEGLRRMMAACRCWGKDTRSATYEQPQQPATAATRADRPNSGSSSQDAARRPDSGGRNNAQSSQDRRNGTAQLPGMPLPRIDSGGLPVRGATGRVGQHAPTRIRRQQNPLQTRESVMSMLPSNLREQHQQRNTAAHVVVDEDEQPEPAVQRQYRDPAQMVSYRWQQERIEMERHQGYEQDEHGEPIIAEGAPAPRPTKEQIKKILAAYPIVKCKGEEVDPCVICLEEFEEEEQMRVLPCFHRFHPQCISLWACSDTSTELTCPTCKTSFAPEDQRR